MIIAELHIEGFKTIRAIDITPDPDNPMVILTGKNGAGKSSVLDAIEAAIAGGKATKTRRPIRDGQDHAEVEVKFGEFIVKRTWDRKVKGGDEFTTALTVRQAAPTELADGTLPYSHVARPQELLDRFWSKLAMNPLEFADMPPKLQQQTLVGLVALPFDPVQLDAYRAEVYARRTEVGRELKAAQGELSAYPAPTPGTPTEEVSASTLLAELQQMSDQKRDREALQRSIADASRRSEALRQEIGELQDLLDKTERARADYVEALAESPEVDAAAEAALREQVATVDETNAAVRSARQHAALSAKLDGIVQLHADLARQITEADEKRAAGLAAAQFPVDGLGFDDDGVTFNGVPFDAVSQAEQWEVSMAIAAALNPELRVFRINQGSLIDDEHRALIAALARKHDAQVWLEVVDEEVGIRIEEGSIAPAVAGGSEVSK